MPVRMVQWQECDPFPSVPLESEGAAAVAPSLPLSAYVEQIVAGEDVLLKIGDVEYNLRGSVGGTQLPVFARTHGYPWCQITWHPEDYGFSMQVQRGTVIMQAPPALGCRCAACLAAMGYDASEITAQRRRYEAMMVLGAIFAGRQLYALQCGQTISSHTTSP